MLMLCSLATSLPKLTTTNLNPQETMDPIIFSIGFTFTTILLIFTLISQIPKITKSKPSNLPRGKLGWPIIGQTTAFISNPEKFIQDGMNQHSPDVFQSSLVGAKMAVFCGPLANKFLFSNEKKLVRSWLPRSIAEALSHPTGTTLTPSRKLADELAHKFVKVDSVQQYVGLMDSMVCEHVNKFWVPFREARVFTLAKEFTFALSCRLFVGCEDREQVKRLRDPFFLLIEGIFSAPVNIPGTPFHKAMKGGELVKARLLEMIKERKKEMLEKEVHHGDMLGRLLTSSDENGVFPSEKDIVSKIIGFMFASFYTTSSTIAFLVRFLTEKPEIYDRVLQEQLEIKQSKGPGELLNWTDIQKMRYSWNTVCETMRLRPPSIGSFKEAITDFTYADFTIPKGWKVHWTVHSTYKNPKYFPNPEEFDPSRFEGSGPVPYTFVPFGGGPCMCAGKEYARIEILVFLHHLVTRFRFKMVNPNEKIIYTPDPLPADGLRVYLLPHNNIN